MNGINRSLSQCHSTTFSMHYRPVEVIPEDTEKDEYRDGNRDPHDFSDDEDAEYAHSEGSDNGNDGVDESDIDDDDGHFVDEEEHSAKLERDLEAIRSKLEAIKIENIMFNEEMEESAKHTTLTAEYDAKIAQYDAQYHDQQRMIEEEEKLIARFQREFEEKLERYNADGHSGQPIDGMVHPRAGGVGGKRHRHGPKSSIVLYDNSFAINHQLQVEIDKLANQIEWLQMSKIELVKNTSMEVDRLRGIIKQFQTKHK